MATDETRERFERLLHAWREDTGRSIGLLKKCAHPAFVEIVGMGQAAVPLIVEELRKGPDDIFCAMPRITGQSVSTARGQGKRAEMSAAWVGWYDARQGHRLPA